MTTAQSYRLICLLILVAIPVYSRHSWPSTPCPNRCKCYRNTDQLKVLNCSSSGLMQFPNVSRIPFDVNIIDVSTNFIEFIPDDVNMHQLHELVALDLSANFLSNFTRLQIPTLSTLDLSNNYITELSDAVFSGVSALRNLNLSGNRLTVIEAAAFKGLVSLWHLDLSRNKLISLPVLDRLHRLIELNLSENLLELLPKGRLSLLRLLRLDVSRNGIRLLEDMALSGCPSLRSLNLSSNKLTRVPRHALLYNGLLSEVDIHSNPIKFIREGDFTSLPNLRRIDLSRTRIEIVEEGGFANLPSLAWLSLNDNPRLVFLHPESFKNLPSLSTLFLHNSNLSTIRNVYTKLPALQNWTLYGNPLVCDCNMKWLKEYINKDSAKHFNRLLCYPEGRGKLQLVRNVKFDDHCLPRIVHCPSMVQLYEGQLLKLSCQAIGNPVPKVHWYFPKTEKIISRSDAAHIENVNRAHGGVYEFVAESSDGIVRHQVEVKVNAQITLHSEVVLSSVVVLQWSEPANSFLEFRIWSSEQQLWGIIPPLRQKSLLVDGLRPSTQYQACLLDNQFTLDCTSFSTPSVSASKLLLCPLILLSAFSVGIALAYVPNTRFRYLLPIGGHSNRRLIRSNKVYAV